MATNSRIPFPPLSHRPALVPKRAPATAKPPSRGHRVLAGLVGLAIVVTMWLYVSRLRNASMESQVAVAPADGEGMQSELEFSNVQMTQAPGNGRLDVYGRVLNQGNHQITRAVVQVTFKDGKGRIIGMIQKPIQGRFKQQYRTLADDFPIGPDESRFFQIVVNQVPPKWDHNLPEIKVITVEVLE